MNSTQSQNHGQLGLLILVFFVLTLLAVLPSCQFSRASKAAVSTPTPKAFRPEISLKHDTADERATKQQLEHLLNKYDLSRWTFSRQVEIDATAIPHSHPVVTLHSRHLRDDLLLLSTYIHEQSHHYCQKHREKVRDVIQNIGAQLPPIPVGYPDGADTQESSLEHLTCVIPLEYVGLGSSVGENQATMAMHFWTTDHYRALYRNFLENRDRILQGMMKAGLLPVSDASPARVSVAP